MREAPKRLNPDEIATVAAELSRHVGGSQPSVRAAAIEPNHVHLLAGSVREDLQKFVGRLNGRTSSEVGKLPKNADRARVWTSGYWKVFLFDDVGVRAVKEYIDAHNIRHGLPAEPYEWIAPCDI